MGFPMNLIGLVGPGFGMRFTAKPAERRQCERAAGGLAAARKRCDVHAVGVEIRGVHSGSVYGPADHQGGAHRMGQSRRMPQQPTLLLASTSIYRRELLSRLRLPFDVVAPDVDETPGPDEHAAEVALRLSLAKARAVAQRHPEAIVIGSDQVAELGGLLLGKPGNHGNAVRQLRAMSAQRVVFHTAVSVVGMRSGFEASDLARVTVTFRSLGDDEIERYLLAERPYDCAGSAKAEALGIALLQSVESDDPTALIGLPLIRTCELLRRAGLDPLNTGPL